MAWFYATHRLEGNPLNKKGNLFCQVALNHPNTIPNR